MMKININKHLVLCFFLFHIQFWAYANTNYNDTIRCALKKNSEQSCVFIFGTEATAQKGKLINSGLTYNCDIGYGFDFETVKNINLKPQGVSSTKGFYFSVKLQEGIFEISVTLGSKDKASITTIKAESKRLMVNKLFLPKGKQITTKFNVDVKSVIIDSVSKIKLKPREKNSLNWDEKLTLEFLGDIEIEKIEIKKIDKIRTLFLAGDSTVTDQDLEPWTAWGQMITNYLNTDVVVSNYAASGSSLASFKSRKRLEKILSLIRVGDYVFIEFGHNDEKIKGNGNGAWGLYTKLLKEFVYEIRKKNGIPVFLTPTQRRLFDADGLLKQTHGNFPNAMRKVSNELNVPLIDLTKMTTLLYGTMGIEESKNLFVHYPAKTFKGQKNALKDNTHFNNFGANEIARCVIQGLKDLDIELVNNLKNNIETYNPKQPNHFNSWHVPLSSRIYQEKPDGN